MAFVIRNDLLTHHLDGAVVLLDVLSGRYLGLNETGAEVWTMLLEGLDAPAIAERLAEEYSVEVREVRPDVDRFVRDLLARGFIVS